MQMLSPFTDSSVNNVLLQPLLEFIDIHKQRLMHDTANTESERIEVRAVGGHRSGQMKIVLILSY